VIDSEAVLRARLSWVRHYELSGDAGLTCRRCGISRPTLRKWWRRYQEQGEAGLCSLSRRRHTPPSPKVTPDHERSILDLRRKRRLGPKGIQNELSRLQAVRLSTATIWQVLQRKGVSASVRPRRRVHASKRYTRPVPGDRVQIDTCKIGKSLYQFTAVDDCTRLRVLRLYDARTAKNAVAFIAQVVESFPFPVQRVQTDRGGEFIGDDFQDALRERKIKFRPNRPRAPHLNGKVERSQQTDRVEFWATVDRKLPPETLSAEQLTWERHYNDVRGHSSLSGATPRQRYEELAETVPTPEAVRASYDPTQEMRHTNNHYTWVYTGVAKTKPSS
jgi:transposase InsO family protein